MNSTNACSRCKPGKPCLSHSFLPFGQAWLELDHPLIRKYPERRIKNQDGRFKQDDAGRYFFSLKGLSFDECPLGWLDWLAGQPWLYEGEFRTRLFAYLRHDCIQRELDDLFPDPDDDSRQPAFSTQVRDRWHGQIRHREEPEPEADNEPAMTITRAWQTVADFLDLDLDALDIGEALEQMYQVKRAMKALFVTNEQRERVRAKYRAVRAMTRRAQLPRQQGQFYSAEQRLFDLIGNAQYVS